MCGQDTYQLYRYPKACRACRCPRRIASASVKPVKSPVLAGVAERGSPLISATRRRPACTSCSSHRECSVSTGGPNRSSSQRRRLSIPFTNSSFSMRRETRTSTTSRLSFPALATVVLRPFFRALRGICANHFSSGIRGLDHDFKFRAVRPYRPARGNWSAMSTASSVRGSVV
jgi:hypothetical protein